MPEIKQTETVGRIERRVLGWMIVAGGAATLAVGASIGVRFAAGLAAGAIIAVVGYAWLFAALGRALEGESARFSKGMAIKLIMRYPVLLGSLYLFYRTKWLPLDAVLAGLFVPLAGGVVECLYQGGAALQPKSRS
ncbi:MAG: hypothetical protein ACRD3D_07405 [Terriglobia bacterium]